MKDTRWIYFKAHVKTLFVTIFIKTNSFSHYRSPLTKSFSNPLIPHSSSDRTIHIDSQESFSNSISIIGPYYLRWFWELLCDFIIKSYYSCRFSQKSFSSFTFILWPHYSYRFSNWLFLNSFTWSISAYTFKLLPTVASVQ